MCSIGEDPLAAAAGLSQPAHYGYGLLPTGRRVGSTGAQLCHPLGSFRGSSVGWLETAKNLYSVISVQFFLYGCGDSTVGAVRTGPGV